MPEKKDIILEGRVIESKYRTDEVDFYLGHALDIAADIQKLKRDMDRLTFAKILATNEVFAKVDKLKILE